MLPPLLERALRIQMSIPPELLETLKRQADERLKAGVSNLAHAGSAPHGDCNAHSQSYSMAFACNQRDEVRDLHDVAGALGAQPGMKQQTFVAVPVNTQIATRHNALGEGTGFGVGEAGDPAYTLQESHSHGVFTAPDQSCLTPWDTQQCRITPENGVAPTVSGADGCGGRNPAGLLLEERESLTPWDVQSRRIHDENGVWPTLYGGEGGGHGYVAAFSAGAGAKAGSISYGLERSPCLKSSNGGNMIPAVICLNDQGGQMMSISQNHTGTLRAEMHGHPPLVIPSHPDSVKDDHMSDCGVYESHGADSRYTGPHEASPAVTARYGTGGNNVPLAINKPEPYTISGPAIDRKPQNGGNGLGVQYNVTPSLTTCDRPAVFSQQRSDEYVENNVACTQAARQYKDATDLVVAGLDIRNLDENGDLSGTLQAEGTGGYSLNCTHPVRIGNLIRRITPLECERLQGFPDRWTDIPGASDSRRYRALGNSVAVPCVEYIMMGIAAAFKEAAAC